MVKGVIMNHNILIFVFFSFIAFFIYGIIKSIQDRLVIFSDKRDLILTFLFALLSFSYIYSNILFPESYILKIIIILTELYLFLIILKNTYIENNNKIFDTILAVYTKLLLSFICIFYIFGNENNKKDNHIVKGDFTNICKIIFSSYILSKFIKKKTD